MASGLEFITFNESYLYPLYEIIISTIDKSYKDYYSQKAIEYFKSLHSPEIILTDANNGYTILLKHHQSLIGTGTLLDATIKRLFVLPKSQSQGFGKLIMLHLEAIALSKDLSKLSICASLPSIKFCENINYKLVKQSFIELDSGEKLHYQDMEKPLQKPEVPPPSHQ